ncbi:hypothetical protein [Streptomyces longwoodensis]|uniref:hypothetical protein n=1 Tax=Streptomyces longwoodensis TaxID=68231 RepID=UPI00082EA929|nr:hypothetical protein [Streptomyces longwoodensis]
MTQQDGPKAPPAPGEHRTDTVEQGRFCFARCACGWRGPARRARSLARTDARGHAADGWNP